MENLFVVKTENCSYDKSCIFETVKQLKNKSVFSMWNVIDELEELSPSYFIASYIVKSCIDNTFFTALIYCPISKIQKYRQKKIKSNIYPDTFKFIYLPYFSKENKKYIEKTYNIKLCKLIKSSFLSKKSLQKYLTSCIGQFFINNNIIIYNFQSWLQILVECGLLSPQQLWECICKHDCSTYIINYYYFSDRLNNLFGGRFSLVYSKVLKDITISDSAPSFVKESSSYLNNIPYLFRYLHVLNSIYIQKFKNK